MLNIPEFVSILGCRYSVKIEAGHLNRNTMGLHRGFQGDILIDSECGPDRRRAVLLHEVIHAIDVACGTELAEREVTVLASGLFAVLRDNPGLVEWLMESEGGIMPIKKGYSKKTIGENIKKLKSEGMPTDQAVAASLRSAADSAKKAGKPEKAPRKARKKGD